MVHTHTPSSVTLLDVLGSIGTSAPTDTGTCGYLAAPMPHFDAHALGMAGRLFVSDLVSGWSFAKVHTHTHAHTHIHTLIYANNEVGGDGVECTGVNVIECE